MPELLKNRYNYQSIQDLALRIRAVYPLFKIDNFINDIIDETWDKLELKARMRKITMNLGRYLPSDYEQALEIIDKIIAHYPVGFNDFTLMYFPDFVEIYGQNEGHWNLSITALERYTKSSSSEFAVRQFIINHEKRMMQQMLAWSNHKNEHVRRLASEGCRPQLPWGQSLASFKKNPYPIFNILEQLKDDPSLYVRKSVANNLNDISKTHPNLVTKIAREWYGKNSRTDWIVKHGCRTLLKKGNRDALDIFGFKNIDCVNVDDFSLSVESIFIGAEMSFSFKIESKKVVKLRLEYGIDYVKANGKRNCKIFQISEISLNANTKKSYTKKHSFADVSTRKHYPGIHSLTLIVNGTKWDTLDFEILATK
ncbi:MULTISPECIES: DNA alkylation repair protein [unclassified Spiroplasma]|uniref:DNA alkylation repair protein n=1 Tax=unclassified Spiroplasma TaxID=2637901 RepID=UPI00313B1568